MPFIISNSNVGFDTWFWRDSAIGLNVVVLITSEKYIIRTFILRSRSNPKIIGLCISIATLLAASGIVTGTTGLPLVSVIAPCLSTINVLLVSVANPVNLPNSL